MTQEQQIGADQVMILAQQREIERLREAMEQVLCTCQCSVHSGKHSRDSWAWCLDFNARHPHLKFTCTRMVCARCAALEEPPEAGSIGPRCGG